MTFVISFIFIFIGGLNHYKEKTWVSPGVLFCYEWGIITFFASLRLFGLYAASTKTWMIIVIGTLFFEIGVYFGRRSKINYRLDKQSNNPMLFKKNIFWILVIFLFAYNSMELLKTISFINSGYSLGEIREASVGMLELANYSRKTGIVYELLDLIMSVVKVFVVASGIDAFISDFNENWKMFLGVFGVEVIDAFSTGSRFTIVYLIVELLVCIGFYRYCGYNIGVSISKKLKKWVKRIVVILILIVLIITIVRGAQLNEILAKYYRYLCGNIKFFDLHIKQIDDSGFYAWGYSGLYGLYSFVLPYLNALGLSYPSTYINTIREVFNTQEFLQIGEHLYTNAFVTPFYHLYADFRLFGVVLGMFVFGLISGRMYRRAVLECNHIRITFYLVVSQMIFKSLQIYPFSTKTYFFAIMTIFLYGKFRIKKRM